MCCSVCSLQTDKRTLMPQVLSSPVLGGSGPSCEGPEDVGGGWNVPGYQEPAGPHPEEELLCWWPALVSGDPSQCDRDLQEGELWAFLRWRSSKCWSDLSVAREVENLFTKIYLLKNKGFFTQPCIISDKTFSNMSEITQRLTYTPCGFIISRNLDTSYINRRYLFHLIMLGLTAVWSSFCQ